MIEQNGIPILAAILEPLIGVIMIVIGMKIFQKYKERKNTSTFNLAVSVTAFALAATISGIGKIVGYLSSVPQSEINYSGFAIILAYIFTVIANIFTMEFLVLIFKEGDYKINKIFGVLNGMTLGFLIPSVSFQEDVYNGILYFLIWHIVISISTYGYLAVSSFKESKQTEQKVPKVGFNLIGIYGVFVSLLFILFVADLVMGMISGSGYTVFYYAGWISGGIAAIFAYMGYVMPPWFKNRISE